MSVGMSSCVLSLPLMGVFLLVIMQRSQPVDAEMFTAVVELERAVLAERHIAQALKVFADEEQRRVDILKRLAENYEKHSTHALTNAEKHLSNPVNAFLVVKRFTTDWNYMVDNYIRNTNASDEFLTKLRTEANFFPTNEDLHGVVDALLRLQDTYALSASQISSGDLQPGLQGTTAMSANDCYDIGRQAYFKEDHYHTVLWMREALRLLDQSTSPPDPADLRSSILDHLAFSTYMQGDIAGALELTEEYLKYDPSNERTQNNRQHYLDAIAKGQESLDAAVKTPTDEYRSSDEFADYERLCRGEVTLYHSERLDVSCSNIYSAMQYHSDRDLTCQYRRHHPFFYINPLREEVLHSNPRIIMYHNAIPDSEITKIRQMATPRLKRATVQNPNTGLLETASYRVSKSAWLKDHEDVIVHRVSDRVKAFANLTGETVEELQVVNYGIGGHYEPHYDHARDTDTESFDVAIGNRIATVMCYLSDVEAGGATVFNLAGARLVPEKGSCALWYNLRRNGEGDSNTRHAACPVLVGSKWVMNKWFHERGEEFIRPCTLSKYE